MGVYVPNMEMPERCEKCFFKTYCVSRIYSKDRPYDCPLIFVPPHGRLIDASTKITVEGYDEYQEEGWEEEMTVDDLLNQCCDFFTEVPTIIPEEEDK